MEKGKYTPLLIFDACVAAVLWLLLIGLRAAGIVCMHWAIVLSGIVWITWLLMGLTYTSAMLVRLYGRLQRWQHRRQRDRRIIAQAESLGVWERPICLGGRALELKAWKDFHIKRRTGERDAQLRRRCMYRADEMLAAAARDKGGKPLNGRALDHYAFEWCGISRLPEESDEHLRGRCMAVKLDTTRKWREQDE